MFGLRGFLMERSFKREFIELFEYILGMWLVFILSRYFPKLLFLGIRPKNLHGLVGVFTSPFLHGSLQHLVQNTIMLAIFGTIYCMMEGRGFIKNAIYLSTISGMVAWLIGKKGIHVGASGLIFGLWAQLITTSLFNNKLKYFIISLFVTFFFGYMIVGIFPSNSQISWESHAGGMLAGILAAKKSSN